MSEESQAARELREANNRRHFHLRPGDVRDKIESVLAELAAANKRCESLHQLNVDACADDTNIRDLCRPVLTEIECDGDSYGVPTVVDIVETLLKKLAACQAERDNFHQCLLNREKSLKAAGDSWVKAKTELDTVTAERNAAQAACDTLKSANEALVANEQSARNECNRLRGEQSVYVKQIVSLKVERDQYERGQFTLGVQLAEKLADAEKSKDAAQAACANLRDCLKGAIDSVLAHLGQTWDSPMYPQSALAKWIWAYKEQNCGTGYVPATELEPTLTTLRNLESHGIFVSKEIERLEALKGAKL